MKERKRKITVITIIGIMLILAITTFTYAIWSRTHTQTGINKNTYACFEISYAETNGAGITMDNGFPQKDEDGLKNKPYEVEIKNKCDTVSTYNVILNKQTGSTLADSHLKVAVDNDYKLLSTATKTDLRQIDNFSNEASYIIGTGVIGPKQTKIVQIRSWMDKDTSEQDGEDKSFTFKITIEAVAGIGEGEYPLKDLVLANSIKDNANLDFSKGFPDENTSEEETKAKSGLYKTEDDDGDTYYFRGDIKNNYVQMGTYKETLYLYLNGTKGNSYSDVSVYYSKEDADRDCDSYYDKMYSYNSAEECKLNQEKVEIAVAGQPIKWQVVRINGDGTIRLLATKPIGTSVFNEFDNNPKYVGYTYDNDEPCTKSSPCTSNFNGNGFTNSEGVGTNSIIKGYLEEWYKNNLKDYDNKIALTTFCNDTSYGSGTETNLSYGSSKRLSDDNEPSFQCPDPTQQSGGNRNYGGVYKLKIGLLNADEMTYAGMKLYGSPKKHNFLFKELEDYNDYYWYMLTMSPLLFTTSTLHMIGAYPDGSLDNWDPNEPSRIISPVINLKSDVTVTGSGTQEDPYVVQ